MLFRIGRKNRYKFDSIPNINYNIIHYVIEKIRKTHMTSKLVKYNKYKHKKSKWITSGLLRSIRFRDNLYKKIKLTNPASIEYETLRINLKTYNNILKMLIQYDLPTKKTPNNIHECSA